MEFLMTYGWAILIIIIVLSSLYFLGVFSPKTPSTCNIQAPFVCSDFKALENGVIFVIGAGKISSGNVDSITVNGQNCEIIDGELLENQKREIECSGIDMSSGKVSADIEISYTLPNSNIAHVITGEGVSNVVETGFIGNLPQGGLVFGWAGNSSYDFISGLTGTLNGGLIIGNTNSEFFDNNATDFERDNGQSIDFGSNPVPTNSSLTISAWINPEGYGQANEGRIVTFANNYPRFNLNFDGLVWQTAQGSASTVQGNLLNRWSHVAVSVNQSGYAEFFVNGAMVSASDNQSGYFQNPSTLVIGDEPSGARAFDGLIDEVHIWDRTLTPEEVNVLYYYYF